jgi:hypothetical protein
MVPRGARMTRLASKRGSDIVGTPKDSLHYKPGETQSLANAAREQLFLEQLHHRKPESGSKGLTENVPAAKHTIDAVHTNAFN